jgi:hypothetical protein
MMTMMTAVKTMLKDHFTGVLSPQIQAQSAPYSWLQMKSAKRLNLKTHSSMIRNSSWTTVTWPIKESMT